MSAKAAVLVLAYGSPENLDDMREYLLDIRGGRETPDDLVKEMTERYRAAGGSPLNRWTQAQAHVLNQVLQQRGQSPRVYVGMRHWHPRIESAVQNMTEDGITEATAIVMAPHYSTLSVSRYMGLVEKANKELGSPIRFFFVTSWWKQPRFLDALEAHVRAGLDTFSEQERSRLKVLFTAHSLPVRILKAGDPYDSDLNENARQIAARIGGLDWMFAYQSAGASSEPWLGPDILDVLDDLAQEGRKAVLAAPIGFVCDHIEILYDLDIEAEARARERGMRLERIESMNVDPLFIEAIADAVCEVTQA